MTLVVKNKILQGKAEEILAKFPSDSVDMVLTSPPYDDIYSYNGNHCYDFPAITKELHRVLKEGKVMVWVEGSKTKDFDESDTPFIHAIKFRDAGFKRLDTMIYQRNGFGKPEPTIRKRYVQSFEFMFVLTKGKINNWNPLKDRPNSCAGMKHRGRTVRQKDGSLKINKLETLYYNNFGLRSNIWKYQNSYGHGTKDKYAYKHPAIFPERLAQDHIRSWSNDGDLILDPFCGSGTTLKMALLNNRDFCGIEVNSDYIAIAQKRIEKYLNQTKINIYSNKNDI